MPGRNRDVKIIIAGGGTGGHLFPGVAVAEEFLKRDRKNNVLFIGTERGLEGKILPDMGFQLRTINVEGIKGKGLMKSIGASFKIPGSLVQSWMIIREFCPDIVIGVGGYASGPAVITAHFMGIKTAIAEQNAIPGITNRILGRFVDRAFLTFPKTKKWFSEEKAVVTGNPIRNGFSKVEEKTERIDDRFALLIFGGSQGAHAINRAVLDSVKYLKEIKDKLKIIHQTGNDDLEWVTEVYTDCEMDAEVLPFIDDMASAYRSADLLICRAGATTIAEITASGKAAILVPFPFATGDHQTENARVLTAAGAAEMIPERDLSGELLAEVIRRFYRNTSAIGKMEEKSASLGNIRAAADIVDECLALVTVS
ncbi:MAG: undecaprenyldiphospho-muramoylpentapeptide beta-N-acetylglucosaminyltransferase [Proteobacteria bacterium]|nr:undecaprenyldiphospho-muramoylpentapeptide beta-N-acetylglucosaminyltransferase [Pseudomonadota bacterium]